MVSSAYFLLSLFSLGFPCNKVLQVHKKTLTQEKGNANSDWKRGLSTLTQENGKLGHYPIGKDNLNTLSNE
jgi:hypothetical protein